MIKGAPHGGNVKISAKYLMELERIFREMLLAGALAFKRGEIGRSGKPGRGDEDRSSEDIRWISEGRERSDSPHLCD